MGVELLLGKKYQQYVRIGEKGSQVKLCFTSGGNTTMSSRLASLIKNLYLMKTSAGSSLIPISVHTLLECIAFLRYAQGPN